MTAIDYELTDRMAATEGIVAMSGIQALMRVMLDQVRADRDRGLDTAGLISGYRGSPVGGMDQAYQADSAILGDHGIKFVSGVNEDLGATAVWGAQQISLEKNANVDGVIGMWYGKGPGVDRSGDALRHANASGVHPNGGVLAVAGDDPFCKSSTIASASECALADLAMPTLYPATVQEVLDFGRFGYELSRFSGSWIGFKIHSNVADAYMTVRTDSDRLTVIEPTFEVDGKPFQPVQTATLIAPFSMSTEADMFGPRLEAAKRFVAANGLDRTFGASAPDSVSGTGVSASQAVPARLGIVAAGPVYGELRDALSSLGLRTDDDLARLGISLYKPALIWPLEPQGLNRFVDGLDEVIVIEEKRSFIEAQIRDLLYGQVNAPRVLGKSDAQGDPMIPHFGGLLAEDLVEPLRTRIEAVIVGAELDRPRKLIPVAVTTESNKLPGRSAYFCSGCPHNRSTLLPDGSMAGGGIGCHGMALGMARENFGITHMGGEGVQWVGMAPFVDENHRFQNIGDGTYAHSGSLAIRQAVSAGTNITFKILYNGTVAMTGGQDAAGAQTVPDLARSLQAEGVAKVVVVADDPDKYPPDAQFAQTRIEHRDRLDDVQLELRDIPGVTVLIYDQACAAELRRGRKRGTIETPTTRIMINEAICEGCGDCGDVSNCASVHPVPTPLGRKTQIHQESCNFDLTCLQGNCPAFISVEVDPDYRPTKAALAGIPDGELPPLVTVPDQANLLLVGIGGTGVVTVNQILATAALLDGKHSSGLDQTGLAQKGGPVVSNLRITNGEEPESISGSNRVGDGAADTLLAFDLLTTIKNLNRASPDRTTAIVSSSLVPTGAMVSGRGAESFPELERFRSAVDGATRSDSNTWIDASGIARTVFGSQPAANVLVLGLAWQKGLLPISSESLERAIELNGVAVESNIEAFRLGRRLAVEPELLSSLETGAGSSSDPSPPALSGAAAKMADSIGGGADLRSVLAWRLPELIAYQNKAYAQRYTDAIVRVRRAEAAVVGDRTELSQTVAAMLFKVMAYKDEYEVARLALGSDIADRARAKFGPQAKVSYQLKPPTLKMAGYDKKIPVPEAAGRAMFQGLLRTKRLRGTKLDPFGRSEERRIERELIDEYLALAERLSSELSPDNYDKATHTAGLIDMVRGYDTVKLDNVKRYRSALAEALA